MRQLQRVKENETELNESIRVGGDYYNTHGEDSKSLPAVQETWV